MQKKSKVSIEEQIQIMEDLLSGKEKIQDAAIKLGYTPRHTRRKLKAYRDIGNSAFVHKNKNRAPVNKFHQSFKDEIIKLFEEKYSDWNVKHYWESFWKDKLSYSSIRTILTSRSSMVKTQYKKQKIEN